jgi:multiple sugar transport system ATP-binding protein
LGHANVPVNSAVCCDTLWRQAAQASPDLDMSVTFVDVSKQYGDVDALIDFHLSANDGEFMVLVGPSGCGKTTALRIVAGLEEPDSGTVFIGGRDVTSLQPRERDIAMVFQNYALYPQMSVYDNIAFGLRTRRSPRQEIDRAVRDAAHALGLSELLKRKPAQLSGGQRQRVALARAIVRRPKAFLMDEPLSNLDAKLRAQTRIELIRLHRQLRKTVLYVTHDQVEAMTMGERIAVLDRGRLQQVGTPADVYDRPANLFVAQFIGTPAMTVFEGALRVDGDRLVVDAGAVTVALNEGQTRLIRDSGLLALSIGVRPEHIQLAEAFGERPAAASFPARVDVIEALGNESHATLLIDRRSIVVRLAPDAPITVGADHRFVIAADHVLLFDSRDGRRIE